MNFFRFVFVVSLLFPGFYAHLQDPVTDSLELILTSEVSDSIRLKTLLNLSEKYIRSNTEKAISFGTDAKYLASKLENHSAYAYAYKFTGNGHYHLGNYQDAIENWEEALRVFRSIRDLYGTANMASNLAVTYSNMGADAKAIELNLEALRLSEELGDTLRMATAYVNLSQQHSTKASNWEEGLEYSKNAIFYGESINYLDAVAYGAYNAGDIFFQQQNFDSAFYYLNKSLEASEWPPDKAAALNYLGRVLAEKRDFTNAIQYHNQAIKLSEENDAKLELCQAYIGLANTYLYQGKTDPSYSTFKKAEQIAENVGLEHELKDSYEGLANTFAATGQWKNAFDYQKALSDLKDRLFNIETDDKIKNIRFAYELDKKQDEIEILEKNSEIEQLNIRRQKVISYSAGISGLLFLLLAGALYNRYKTINRSKKIIEKEKKRSDDLLLNILPHEIAEELKEKGQAQARKYEQVSIMFTDFEGFTKKSSLMSPEELVKNINECYKAFDEIVTRYGIEKIKTIGDAYMAVGGLPIPGENHATDVVNAAIDIRDFIVKLNEKRKAIGQMYFDIRIGIHSGPVVAGIVGTKKFAYDIWGDSVNIASRIESSSVVNKINISETTYQLVKEHFEVVPRGKISIKGAKEKKMYFVERKNGVARVLD